MKQSNTQYHESSSFDWTRNHRAGWCMLHELRAELRKLGPGADTLLVLKLKHSQPGTSQQGSARLGLLCSGAHRILTDRSAHTVSSSRESVQLQRRRHQDRALPARVLREIVRHVEHLAPEYSPLATLLPIAADSHDVSLGGLPERSHRRPQLRKLLAIRSIEQHWAQKRGGASRRLAQI